MKKAICRTLIVLSLLIAVTLAVYSFALSIKHWEAFFFTLDAGFILGQYKGINFFNVLIVPSLVSILLLLSCVFWFMALLRGKVISSLFASFSETKNEIKAKASKNRENRKKKKLEHLTKKINELKGDD